MNLIKLGKKVQVSVPQRVLRQVSVHPVEMYSDERLAEFERENTMTPAQLRKFGPQIANFSAGLQEQPSPPT